ncbi:MAG: hypothetical protein MJZ64_00670 [Paludibacteraceae bacterium]|nr:hypothetical protein [Paludibacteraceae bacterium]
MKKFNLILVLLVSATAFVSAQAFQSTSSEMMNTGSSLSSNIYGVGAEDMDYSMASTTSNGPARRTLGGVTEDEEERSGQSPIGAPYIMLLFAAATGAVIALRRRKLVN